LSIKLLYEKQHQLAKFFLKRVSTSIFVKASSAVVVAEKKAIWRGEGAAREASCSCHCEVRRTQAILYILNYLKKVDI